MENPETPAIGEESPQKDIDKIDPNIILKEVKDFHSKKLYIITKEIESKIPSILSYIQDDENEILNKIHIINYLLLLIQNIPYNLELILSQKSDIPNQNMNIYEILIYEYIFTDKNETDYIKLLKDILILIFKKLSLNKDVYRYIFSYISTYLNEKNNIEKNTKYYFNESNYYNLLELILLFYQSKEDEDPINYFYFNGDINTNITINNRVNNILDLENNLYILLFVKLVDYEYISSLKQNNKETSPYSSLIQIKFKNKKEIISLNIIDSEQTPNNTIIEDKQQNINEPLKIINIPYNSFNKKETNNILIKITSNLNLELYINGNSFSLPEDIISTDKKDENIIEYFQLFKGFYGICSTIMVYKGSSKDKIEENYPEYLLEQDNDKKRISKYYQNGIFKEEMLIPFIKADIKNIVLEKNIFDNTLKNLTEQNLNLLQQFINYNLLSIYMPKRTYLHSELKTKIEGNKEIEEVIRTLILVDSFNNLNAVFKNRNLYPNLKYSRYGGVHNLSNIIYDFSFDIGGINHLLSLIEIMTDYNELLSNKNLEKFMNILLYFFSNHKRLIINEQDTRFFYYLSIFLEKIPEKFYKEISIHIKSILITLSSLESEIISDNERYNIFNIYKQEFFNNICLNEKILFRFSFQDKNLIYNLIYKYLFQQTIENNNIEINTTNLINILLYHEKERYTHFCCKKHAAYFNKESKIMEPELNEQIKPLIDIIKLLINQFFMEYNNINDKNANNNSKLKANNHRTQLLLIFKLLTFDISPCLQINILNLFFKYISDADENFFQCLNLNNQINLITLFLYKTSLFDVKELAFNYLINLLNKESNKNTNLAEYLDLYTTYYYYPKNIKQNNTNFKQSIIINNTNYVLTEFTESQKQLLSFYDKSHLYDLMNHIYEKAKSNYKVKILQEINFNVLLSITSKGDATFILNFLNLIKEELEEKNNTLSQNKIIYNSQKLLQWLLDTCYHASLIKNSIIKKEEFVPAFSFKENTSNEEKEKIADNVILLSSNILIEIFYNNVYKLDYLLTWSKYYYEINEDKNRFLDNMKFIFENFIDKLINKFVENNSKKKIEFKTKLYLANIVFEYFAYHKIKGFASGGVLKDLESLYNQVCIPFIFTLLSELKDKTKSKDDNLDLLNEKWDEYPTIKNLLGNLEFFDLEKESKMFNDNINIPKDFIFNKQNMFINELKYYFINFKKNENYFNKNNYCNQGMELIILKYHYFTLVLTVITVQMEYKEILNNFSSFILLIIISSTTLSIDNSKSQNKNSTKQREIWPTEGDYKEIQETIKIIIFNFIFFLKEKIIDMTNKIKKYEEQKDTESQNFFENYNLIKNYLINVMFFFLKLLNQIHSNVKKQEIKRKNSEGYFKGLYNKLKNKISSDKEGVQLTGGFLFIDEFKNNCIKNKINNFNVTESSDSTDNFVNLEENNSFLDDIPIFTLNQIHERDYSSSQLSKQLLSIYNKNFENNEKINDYFNNYKEKYQRQLFPFINYILKRNKQIGNIIPIYDNSIYTTYDYSFLCLKPNYLPKLSDTTIKIDNVPKLNNYLVNIMKEYQIKTKFNEHDKIRRYRKIKKKLFSFNGILSTKKYFYDKKKYICKYRLLNHMTEDYTKIFFTPIIDIDYYLPKFSKFELENLFRKKNKDNLIQITKLADLSLKPHQKEEEKNIEEKEDISSLNGLYFIKEAEFKNSNEIYNSNEGTLNHYNLFKDFIDEKHQITQNYHNNLQNSCLVKTSYHIRGFFYSNSTEIGFYSYDKIPYKNKSKKSKKNKEKEEKKEKENENESENKDIKLIQKDYDPDREACFGSVFSPQIEKNEYMHLKIPYNKIVFVFKRRYYFKVCALEIFTTDKKCYLFKFDHSQIKDIINNLKHFMLPKIEDIYIEHSKFYNKIGFMNLNSIDENMHKRIYEKNYMNLKNIYDKWKKWEISNLRLLMLINIYANRSYNDINQYPVFPWIIIDYKSEKFPKINSEKLMRPLDTPMGMLTINNDAIQRREDYLAHWQISQDDDDREDEYDRYGSHYSTSLYVSYYLVRIFPFAYIRIELQGTSFDDPNRLFNSMSTSFDCSSTQKSDLRELIPELFCLPEMLLNNNDFNLGEIKDNSENTEETSKKGKLKEIQEVVTPKWCDNNPYNFIKKHREVLESYEVSNNLNKWLNLIFGSKQKGAEGNKIKNLYNCQTYEDYEKVFDQLPLDEQDIACRMLEFGVTPNQIFKNDASQRKINLDSKIKSKLFFNTLENYKQNQINNVAIKNNLSFEEVKGIMNLNSAKRIYYFPKDKNSENLKNNIYIMNNSNIDIYYRKLDKHIIRSDINPDQIPDFINPYYGGDLGDDEFDEISMKIIEKKEGIKLNNYKYADINRQPIIWLDKGTILVKGGYWNGNFIIRNLNKPKDNNNVINPNYEEIYNTFIYTTSEYSPITKIVVDKNETFAICGNTNGTISIYHINPHNKISWSIYKSINNHNSPIQSIAIHENLNIAITCSEDGLCMLYTLPYFQLYNSFIIGKEEKNEEILCPDIVLISDKPLPCFIFYVDLKKTIYFYSINGHFLKKQKLNFSIKENTIKIYTDYQFVDYLLIYNTKNKSFDLYTMIDFTLIFRSPSLPDGDFIDCVLDKDMNHILVLCKDKNEYKLYILKDSETRLYWK